LLPDVCVIRDIKGMIDVGPYQAVIVDSVIYMGQWM
jgi:hypothetical protein